MFKESGMSLTVTAETIRRLFEERKIEFKGSRSSKESLHQELAASIALYRLCFEQTSVIAREAQRRIVSYLEGLLQEIPAVIQTNRHMADLHKRLGKPAKEALEQQSRLINLQRAANDMLRVGIGWRIFPVTESWEDFTVPLANIFRREVQSVDPNLDLRPSNEGPLVKFLQGSILFITEQNIKLMTIARHLQREERKGNTMRIPESRQKSHFFKPSVKTG
jgi:hypothetical protein